MAPHCPVTSGVRSLREKGIPFQPCLYRYMEGGGTARAAAELGVPEHTVIKTLVMCSDAKQVLLVLMHGDCQVSTKKLARALVAKTVAPCDRITAEKTAGYTVGGISPFGTRSVLPVFVESSILELDRIYINAGKRGFLVAIDPQNLRRAFPLVEVSVALPPNGG